MRSDARIAAAITILDDVLAKDPAERVLVNWARANRYAGSSDRAAVRDLVFGALRRRRSDGWLGGGDTGRALMLGHGQRMGDDALDTLFGASRYGPEAVSPAERGQFRDISDAPDPVRYDCQDQHWPVFQADYGADAVPILARLQDRAPIFLRVNTARISRETLLAQLTKAGIGARPMPLVETAIEVVTGERRLRGLEAFQKGLFEFQDAASQAAVQMAAAQVSGKRVLDYCAGGGGKALAFAALGFDVTAHDADAKRMTDLPERAGRAGVDVRMVSVPKDTFDMVFCDAPCSGSGAWRRQPDAKWAMDANRLEALHRVQAKILDTARHCVAPGGVLAYATCSLWSSENQAQVDAFTKAYPDWRCLETRQWTPLEGADGFFLALLGKS
jgi:16S rRNA (cytosine967-C5)-methyltransferase